VTVTSSSTVRLTPRIPGCPVPLTATQFRAWRDVVNRGTQLSKFRLCAASLRLLGRLDVRRLRDAIECIAHRHEPLRTRIAASPDGPRQLIDAPLAFELPLVDISNSHSDRREDLARTEAEEFISEEVDLAIGPLFAARLFRLAQQDHVLVLGVDHFISDAVSFSILTSELLTLYREREPSENHSLPQLTVQFPDFAVWQAGTQEAWTRLHAAYWQSRLSSAEKFRVPLDGENPSDTPTDRDFLHIPFGKGLSAALTDKARRDGTPMPLVVLSIQLVIMSEWCQKDTLLVELLSHGRKASPVLRNMVGFLAYPMYLLVAVAPAETFKDLLRRVIDEYHQALEHDASRITADLIPGPTELRFNWVQADLRPQWRPVGPVAHEMELRILPFPVRKPFTATFGPHYFPTPSGVVAEIWYGRGLFEKGTLNWFENGLRSIAREVVHTSNVRIGDLKCLCAR
jgi:hypothetical protein